MKIDITNHPCFNDKTRHKFGRIHLPVAQRCNIQCNFCSRKFDCVSESRPGVTSTILTPMQALVYLNKRLTAMPNISVVGIAGPGDPFANPEETIGTLKLVRELYPSMILCVASNGLNILPFVNELADLNVSHVTITLNAIDVKIASKIYAWIRINKRVYTGEEGAAYLLQNQLNAIQKLKEKGIVVKINTIIIPGINDEHIIDVAKKAAELKADLLNCIPIYPVENTPFYNMESPGIFKIKEIRKKAAEYIPQMNHCSRCRADAAGLIGEDNTPVTYADLDSCKTTSFENSNEDSRSYFAAASMEGLLVNQHLGEAAQLFIYKMNTDIPELMEIRNTPASGTGMKRWRNLGGLLKDCKFLMVSGIGDNPKKILTECGLTIYVVEGMISEVAYQIMKGENINQFIKTKKFVCGTECTGASTGCG